MIGAKAIRCTAALTLTLIAAMTLPTPAQAACGLTDESVAKAQVVFVGLLAEVSADGHTATFQVEEVWRGSELVVGKGVAVDTTNALQRLELPPAGVSPSDYVVLANTVDGQLHTGDSCEIFPFPWDASYAAFRSADAPPAAKSAGADAGVPAAVVVVVAGVLVLAVVSAVAFRRRSG